MRMFYTELATGRLANFLQIQIDNEILIKTHDYFDPNDETHIKILYSKIQRKHRKGNLMILGLWTSGQKPYGEFGEYWIKYRTIYPETTLAEFKKIIDEVLEYKDIDN